MTIYTDPTTGLKYDRVHGGLQQDLYSIADFQSCKECAFSDSSHCVRHPCVVNSGTKTVYFVFKERKA